MSHKYAFRSRSYQQNSRLLHRRWASGASLVGRPTTCRRNLRNSATCRLNIAFVSAEVAPWSRTGALGDMVGALPIELARRGHRVMTIAPRYDQHSDLWDTSKTQTIDGEVVNFFHTIQEGVDRVFVDHPWFLEKVWGWTGDKLYGSGSGADYLDNQRRFLLFNKAALRAIECLDPKMTVGVNCVVVANDWHTAILPVLVKEVYQKEGMFTRMRTALCILNIAFQGRFWRRDWAVLSERGVPDRLQQLFDFTDGDPRVHQEGEVADEDSLPVLPGEQYRKLNWLQAGILAADKLLTVSPTYAAEIASDSQKGVELDAAVRAAGGAIGICNGVDLKEWAPYKDRYLDVRYDASTLKVGKASAKAALQAQLGLKVDANTPLFGFIGRLEEQNGVDILLQSLPIAAGGGGLQVVVLGTGNTVLQEGVLALEQQYPGTAKGVVKFDDALAHRITAGADFMLVPSRSEPCGLIQLLAMCYGTVPVVASTGGLLDTVRDNVTGFHAGRFKLDVLDPADSAALASAMQRAAAAFSTPEFHAMQMRCISQELGWDRPARKWQSILEELWLAPPRPVVRPPPRQEDMKRAEPASGEATKSSSIPAASPSSGPPAP